MESDTGYEENEAAFNRSAVTSRTPPLNSVKSTETSNAKTGPPAPPTKSTDTTNMKTGPPAKSTDTTNSKTGPPAPPAECDNRPKVRVTTRMLLCVSCKKSDQVKKVMCPACSLYSHLACIEHLTDVRDGKWRCCNSAIIEIDNILEERTPFTGTVPKHRAQESNSANEIEQTNLTGMSNFIPECGAESTKRTSGPPSHHSSAQSRASVTERLKLAEQERELRILKLAAEAQAKDKQREIEQKQLEAEMAYKAQQLQLAYEKEKAEEAWKALEAEEQFLRDKRDILESGSRHGSSIQSVSSVDRRQSVSSWIDENLEQNIDAEGNTAKRTNERSGPRDPVLRPARHAPGVPQPESNNVNAHLPQLNSRRPYPRPNLRERNLQPEQPNPRSPLPNYSLRNPRNEPRNISSNNSATAKSNESNLLLAPWLQYNATTEDFLDSTLGGNASLVQDLNLTRSQILARQVIPKEIPPFSGDPMQWPVFISAFANTTHQCGFTAEENMARLTKCLKGAAYEAVRTDLLLPSSLGTALTTLRMMYGRPQLIFEAALEHIRQAPTVRLERLETVVTLALRVKSFCDVVRTAGMEDYLRNPTLVNELVEKLPPTLKMEWGRHRRAIEMNNPGIGIDIFEQWIRENAETASCLSNQPVGPIHTSSTQKKFGSKTADIYHAAHEAIDVSNDESPSDVRCPFCKTTGHKPTKCAKYEASSIKQRWALVRENRLCVGCLGNHWVRVCRYRQLCGIDGCEKPHNPTLHQPVDAIQTQRAYNRDRVITPTPNNTTLSPINSDVIQPINAHSKTSQHKAYYQVVPVTLYGKQGRSVKTFAFLDGGSTVTLLEQAVADKLGLQGVPENLTLKWTNEVTRCEPASRKIELRVAGTNLETYALKDVHTASHLSLPRQAITQDEIRRHQHLNAIHLEVYDEIQPELLIGLDNHQLLAHLEIAEGEWTSPTAVRTRLGWSLLGGAQNTLSTHGDILCHREADRGLHELVKEFFDLESIGIKMNTRTVESREDNRAKELLGKTVTRTPEGRYQAGLLWTSDDVVLPTSRSMAEHRHRSFERRLARDPELKEAVKTQIADYIEQGYLVKLTPNDACRQTDRTWYLPMFAIKNPNKPAKIRLVWDAAATVNGTALNDKLLTGPDLLKSLVGVLLKFREHPIAVAGDIKQMFHQIRIRSEDQDAQRCLWRDDLHGDIDTYKMTVMTFGAACSPSTAQYVKNLNASRYQAQHPRAVEAIHHRHYVDDYIDSFSSEDECIKITTSVTAIHKAGGFELRNFVSNSSVVLQALTNRQAAAEIILGNKDSCTTVLGMRWRTDTDTLCFRVNTQRIGEDFLKARQHPTKREVLRILMMVFDPLGMLGFFVLQGKLVLKEIWRTGIDWDDKLLEAQAFRWAKWVQSLQMIETVAVPRCYLNGIQASEYELHTFVDASEHAAAAVVYIVAIRGGVRSVSFVTCKTKIAPTKAISIPRLELQAAVIGTRLANMVAEQQAIKFNKMLYWSDSRNVLCWIRTPRTFKPFVALRIGEILDASDSQQWFWVPTTDNIADEATKWKLSPRYCIPPRWFQGPEFLWTADYPQERPHSTSLTDDELEVRCLLMKIEEPTESLTPDFHRFRKLRTLLRVQVRILRVFNRNRRKFGNYMTPEELDEARLYLIRSVQIEAFGGAWYAVKEGQPVPRQSPLYALSPLMDSQSIIRMRSRLRNAEYLTYNQRCPIILPRQHPFTDILLISVHERYYHQNFGTVLNEIRQEYHIPKLRSQLQAVRKSCQRCKIRDARPEVPEMAPLPQSRIAARMRPFTYVGVDYFGPMTVKIGRRSEKRWGAIFTCLTIRAIHIELSSSLSADSFLLMLRSFIARRGMPREVCCDNGTNFVGAASELRKTLLANISRGVQERYAEITWRFNPPAAPHMGGAWERLIRSVKRGLEYALPERNPTEELLRCCLTEVESIVNSRPLTYVETEPHTLEALTPNHFLLGSSAGTKPYGYFTDDVNILRKEWQRQQNITNKFWTRWVGEYLPTISQRTKWYDPVKPLQVGDVVAVVLSEVPYSWQLGRIVSVITSKDGSVRQADVQTASGVVKRPASKLAILVREKLENRIEFSTGGSVANEQCSSQLP